MCAAWFLVGRGSSNAQRHTEGLVWAWPGTDVCIPWPAPGHKITSFLNKNNEVIFSRSWKTDGDHNKHVSFFEKTEPPGPFCDWLYIIHPPHESLEKLVVLCMGWSVFIAGTPCLGLVSRRRLVLKHRLRFRGGRREGITLAVFPGLRQG